MARLPTAISLVLLVVTVHCLPADKRQTRQSSVPSFVTQYAPLVYLHSTEAYFPSDIGAQLSHTHPEVNYAVVSGAPSPLTLDNLDSLNALGGSSVYLTSIDDTTTEPRPSWLHGVVPDSSGKTANAISCAIIVNDYGNGTVDAYYMYFYAYNWGGLVLGLNFDDHVGDWEHNMIRFEDSKPTALWFSQHSSGEAFTYAAVAKAADGLRPLVYSANGSHANYATVGAHDHTIPGLDLPDALLLTDYTDRGVLWDPAASAYYVGVTFGSGSGSGSATPSFTAYDDATPLGWLSFVGHWGDEQYPGTTPGQYGLFGQYRYSSGPTGPEDKDLNRGDGICPSGTDPCIVMPVVWPGS